MNVANLELCKELYELSGWRTEDEHPDENFSKDGHFAYDLGYLLRKLPYVVDDELLNIHLLEDSWLFRYGVAADGRVVAFANEVTPEDTACKLAIELFKQGILK